MSELLMLGAVSVLENSAVVSHQLQSFSCSYCSVCFCFLQGSSIALQISRAMRLSIVFFEDEAVVMIFSAAG